MKKVITLILGLALLGCGGGGGGGDGSSSGSSRGVRVMHAAIDASPVELRSSLSPGTVYQTVRFAEAVRYGSVPQGQQIIELTRARSNSGVAASNSINYQGGRASVLLFGSLDDGGLRTTNFADSVPELSGAAAVRIVNGLQNAPALLVRVAGKTTPVASYGTAGDYLLVDPGVYPFTIASGATTIETGTINVTAGRSYSILAAGRMHYFTVGTVFED